MNDLGAARARWWRRLIAMGALAYSLWALVGTGTESLMWGAILLLARLTIYLWQVTGEGAPKSVADHIEPARTLL